MRVFDEKGNELKEYDSSKGWVEHGEKLIAHHEEVPAVPAKSHIEVLEGSNGLRHIVIDAPEVPAVPAWDEYEDILIFHPYTEAELAERNKPSAEQRLTNLENAVLELMLRGGSNV